MKVIPYVEIISPQTFLPIQIVEPKECWFELGYNDIGQFEVYAPATRRNLECLQKGNFVKMPNVKYIWVITSIEYTFTADGSRMISARGYECIWLLKRCIVRYSLQLPNSVTNAFQKLIDTFYMQYYSTGYGYYLINIDTQLNDTLASRGNLLEYIHNMAKSYGCNIHAIYDDNLIKFSIREGQDKSDTVKFSQSNDNLLSFNYLSDDAEKANTVYVVAKVDDKEYTTSYTTMPTDDGKIIVIHESSLTNKYININANGKEETLELNLETDDGRNKFIEWLKEDGKLELAKHATLTEIKSTIDLKNSNYELDRDYQVGDIVEVKDEFFNVSAKQRIVKYTIRLESTGIVSEALDFGE